uniref:hypothetical protein n=1 Tax=Paractinoplanes polyasparticus TaxID=2856853 RepID=UPI001C84DD99|nr:hypothetical protein [Actinoplanes polyasparticus]
MNTMVDLFRTALSRSPRAEALPDPSVTDHLAAPGYRARLLREAGMGSVGEDVHSWGNRIRDQKALLETLNDGPFAPLLKTLEPAARAEAETRVTDGATTYREPDGKLPFPGGLPAVLGSTVSRSSRAGRARPHLSSHSSWPRASASISH